MIIILERGISLIIPKNKGPIILEKIRSMTVLVAIVPDIFKRTKFVSLQVSRPLNHASADFYVFRFKF